MIVTCQWCWLYIETDNRSWPGYCGAGCRDKGQDYRRAELVARRRARIEKAERRAWRRAAA